MEEKINRRYNKATLIAAALIITGSTAIFGTFANSDEDSRSNGQNPPICTQQAFDYNQKADQQNIFVEKTKE